jgi:galactoside O-acetyltransferase
VIQHDAEIHAAPSVRVDSFVKLEAGLGMYLGEFVHIASFAHIGIGGGLTILDDGASVGSGGRIITGSNIAGVGHGCSAIAPDAIVRRSFVHIGKNATVYAGATVLPGVTVGEGAVVAAGAVLRNDAEAGEIWAGVPARLVGIVGGKK